MHLSGLVKEGVLRATSVGFKPLKWRFAKDRPEGIDFLQAELMEFSLVTVPANSEALMEMSAVQIEHQRACARRQRELEVLKLKALL